MEIFFHRYLLEGADKAKENTFSQLRRAVAAGRFFETDIRRLAEGDFYISHDPMPALTGENNALDHCRIWKETNCKIALNIKELGYEADLAEFLKRTGVIGNVFLFDFDLALLGAEPQGYINKIHRLVPDLACAVRVSDRGEPVSRALRIRGSNIVWLDEFDKFWAVEADIKRLKQAGKTIYCVAPDLHGHSLAATKKRWKDFIIWGVDGICTDYPLLLKEILAKYSYDQSGFV